MHQMMKSRVHLALPRADREKRTPERGLSGRAGAWTRDSRGVATLNLLRMAQSLCRYRSGHMGSFELPNARSDHTYPMCGLAPFTAAESILVPGPPKIQPETRLTSVHTTATTAHTTAQRFHAMFRSTQ